MDANQKGGAVTAPKNAEPEIAIDCFPYVSKTLVKKGKALKTLTLEDGTKVVRYTDVENVPEKTSLIVEQVLPEKVSMGMYGAGWYGLLKSLPADCTFAIKLRKALEYQAAHVCLWDADKNTHVVVTAQQAAEYSAPIRGAGGKLSGVRF